jgi:hypothetical protein
MIPVQSVSEVEETIGSAGFSYLSLAFGDGKQPKRMTYVPVRDMRGVVLSLYFIPAEVL